MNNKCINGCKRLLALLLVACLTLGVAPAVLAADDVGSPDGEAPVQEETVAPEQTNAPDAASREQEQPEEEAQMTDPAEPSADLPEELDPAQEKPATEAAEQQTPETELPAAEEPASDEPLPADEEPAEPTAAVAETPRMLAASTAGPESEYGIVLGADGVTSGNEMLDEGSYTLGAYSVNKTYILSFQEESFTVTNQTGGQIRATSNQIILADGTTPSIGSFTTSSRTAAYLRDTIGARLADRSALDAIGYADLDEDATAFYYLYITTVDYAILIQITPNGAADPVKTARETLGEQIAGVTGENADNYYQSDDRYNGRSYSENGFWSDMQTVLTAAQSVYDKSTATAEELTAAASSLAAAVEALIPADCVNPTELYEAMQTLPSAAQEAYTSQSWLDYETAFRNAEELLDSLFSADGFPSDTNKRENQTVVSEVANALKKSVSDLFLTVEADAVAAEISRTAEMVSSLIAAVEKVSQADFTAESWTAFSVALEEAKTAPIPSVTRTIADQYAADEYATVYKNLFDAYYYKLIPIDNFEITLDISDVDKARTNRNTFGVCESVSCTPGTTLGQVISSYGISSIGKVMINGIWFTQRYLTPNEIANGDGSEIVLHPGDQIAFLGNIWWMAYQPPTVGTTQALIAQLEESIRTHDFAENEYEIEAGKALDLLAEKRNASLRLYNGIASASNGLTLFISDVQPEQGGKVTTTPFLVNGERVETDINGHARIALYEEGWYLIQAYDLRTDELGSLDNTTGLAIPGEYYSTANGASVWVHITASSEPEKIKEDLLNELSEVYNACDRNIFSDADLAALDNYYSTAVTEVNAAGTTGEARTAQQTGISLIKSLFANVKKQNESKLNTFRNALNRLPDNVSLITVDDQPTVDTLLQTYENMHDYLKNQFTLGEVEKYQAVAALGELPETKEYALTVNIAADNSDAETIIESMVEWLQDNTATDDKVGTGEQHAGDRLSELYRFCNWQTQLGDDATAKPHSEMYFTSDIRYAAYFLLRDAENHILSGERWLISDENISFSVHSSLNYSVNGALTILIDGEPYEVKSIQYSGVDVSDIKLGTYQPKDYSTYKGKESSYINMHFANSYAKFDMPYNDVTVTVTWGPANDEKEAAIEELTDYYNEFVQGNYTDENWERLYELYQEGVAAIKGADAPEAVKEDYKSRLDAVEKKGNTSLLGSVTVTFSNHTMPDGPWYDEAEPFVSETISLYDTDTLMTVALRALEVNDYTWSGTGGTADDPYSITYLSAVTHGVDTLSEKMPGYSSSGWMGTLNNWFVHKSLQEFSVESGELKNGDTVAIVFTCDQGIDVHAGYEGVQDTAMATIAADTGTLSPAFDAEVMEYVLTLPDGQETVKLTFEPQWKCFQARAYKGSYAPAADRYYSSGDAMYLTNGDVVYVASGDPAWPSMSGNDDIALSASVYKITVITSAAAAEVEKLISTLKTVQYNNYKSVSGSVENARTAYNALSDAAKAELAPEVYEKLTEAEQLIAEYSALDGFKEELAAVDADTVDKETAKALVTQFDSMSDNQKKNLTVAEVNKIELLRIKADIAAEVAYGDVNGDGRINTKDVILLRQYIAKYDVESLDLGAADVNGDGKINTKDVILLRQYIAKYDVTLGPTG